MSTETFLWITIRDNFEGYLRITAFRLKNYTLISNLLTYYCKYLNMTEKNNLYFYKDNDMIDHSGTIASNNIVNGVSLEVLEAEE